MTCHLSKSYEIIIDLDSPKRCMKYKIQQMHNLAVIQWAASTASKGLQHGRCLNESEVTTARKMGVIHPELIRLVIGPVPMPTDRLLKMAISKLGFGAAAGITLGHAIFLGRDLSSPSDLIFSHECRHVHQYETKGDLASFVTEFIRQFAMYGYLLAPWEVDARHSVSLFL